MHWLACLQLVRNNYLTLNVDPQGDGHAPSFVTSISLGSPIVLVQIIVAEVNEYNEQIPGVDALPLTHANLK